MEIFFVIWTSVSVFLALLFVFILTRNEMVHKINIEIIDRDMTLYHALPSYEEMMMHPKHLTDQPVLPFARSVKPML